MYDIIVIGAGPSGNYVSSRLAKSGFKVAVLEEHPEIGKPIHCTGVIGEKVFQDFTIPSNSIIRQLSYFKVFGPTGNYFHLPKKAKPYIVNRAKFDYDLAQISIKAGSDYYLETKVVEIENLKNKVIVKAVDKKNRTKKLESKLCILATGAMSNLPYKAGLGRSRYFYKSVQTDLAISDLDGAEIYTGHKIAPGSFAYAVSIDEKTAKVGLITRTKAKACFENLLKIKPLKGRIQGTLELVRYRRIPFGVPKRTQLNRLLSVGDAAGQIKTTTGGGVFFGLLSANILANVIKKSYKNKNFLINKLSLYDQLWKKEISQELQAGLLVRSFFERVEDKYIDKLFKLLKNPDVLKIIERSGDYELHRNLLIALMKIPEVRRLAFEIIRKNLPKKNFFLDIFSYVGSLTNLV